MSYKLQELQERFFNDPLWAQMEELILEHINPLLDMTTIDTTQPSEAVKAEVIGRSLAYDSLFKFLNGVKAVTAPPRQVKNPFR